jgi:hypothetical protein
LQVLLTALWQSKLIQFDAFISEEHEKAFWFQHAILTIPQSALTIANNVTLAIALEQSKQVTIPIANILSIKPSNKTADEWVDVNWVGFSSTPKGSIASTVLGSSFLRGKTIIFDRGQEDKDIPGRIGFADAAGCCGEFSALDVDILLSVDHVSRLAAKHSYKDGVRVGLFVLAVITALGLASVVLVLLLNFASAKWVKLRQSKRFKEGEHEIALFE